MAVTHCLGSAPFYYTVATVDVAAAEAFHCLGS